MFKRILIPTDGSALSHNAIMHGIEIAKANGASVVGFHGRPPRRRAYFGDGGIVVSPDIDTALEQQTIAEAEKCLAEITSAASAAGVPCKVIHKAYESPADGILETAQDEQCDLIVMASHGRKGLSRVLLGSETNTVVTHAKMPVLVTH